MNKILFICFKTILLKTSNERRKAMFQKVTLIGNLGQDPIVRYTPSGTAVVNMSLATNKTMTVGDEKKKFTEWHRIVGWGKLAEMIAEMKNAYRKGKQLFIEGELRTRSWEDKNKITRYTTEVIAQTVRLLGPAPAAAPPVEAYEDDIDPSSDAPSAAPMDDDDIPF